MACRRQQAERELVDIERWLADQEDVAATDAPALSGALGDADAEDQDLHTEVLVRELVAREVDLPGDARQAAGWGCW